MLLVISYLNVLIQLFYIRFSYIENILQVLKMNLSEYKYTPPHKRKTAASLKRMEVYLINSP